MKYAVRYSAHIQADINRGWSSWNFGKGGFNGTWDELQAYLANATDEDPIEISLEEVYASQLPRLQFGELYTNYWVLIDTENANNGLSCDYLQASSLEEAINEGFTFDGSGCGSPLDVDSALLLYSEQPEGIFGMHIFLIED